MTFAREEPETSTHSTTVSFSLPKQRHSPCFSVSATLQVTMDCLEPQLQGHTMNKAVSALKESTIWSLGWYAKTRFYSAGKETQSITILLCHGVWVSSLKRNTSGWVLPIYLCNMTEKKLLKRQPGSFSVLPALLCYLSLQIKCKIKGISHINSSLQDPNGGSKWYISSEMLGFTMSVTQRTKRTLLDLFLFQACFSAQLRAGQL